LAAALSRIFLLKLHQGKMVFAGAPQKSLLFKQGFNAYCTFCGAVKPYNAMPLRRRLTLIRLISLDPLDPRRFVAVAVCCFE
jgi:hypothetical protein